MYDHVCIHVCMYVCGLPVCLSVCLAYSPPLTATHHHSPPLTTTHHYSPLLTTTHRFSCCLSRRRRRCRHHLYHVAFWLFEASTLAVPVRLTQLEVILQQYPAGMAEPWVEALRDSVDYVSGNKVWRKWRGDSVDEDEVVQGGTEPSVEGESLKVPTEVPTVQGGTEPLVEGESRKVPTEVPTMQGGTELSVEGDTEVALTVEALNQVVVTQAFRLNNVALKWIRDNHEYPPGFPTVPAVDITATDPFHNRRH